MNSKIKASDREIEIKVDRYNNTIYVCLLHASNFRNKIIYVTA